MTRAIFFNLVAILIFLTGVAFFFQYVQPQSAVLSNTTDVNELSAASVSIAGSTSAPTEVTGSVSTSTNSTTTVISAAGKPQQATTTKSAIPKKSSKQATNQASTPASDQVSRIQDPYSTSPESFDQVNADARSALVNILCEPGGGSSLNPISGSGVLIDPRGIILTNAHVAQYVLLSESPQIDLKCYIRTGSPASPQWYAAVLYIPPVWVSQHVSEINQEHPTGTGEHDYALLYVTASVNGNLPAQFPYIPVDIRPAIGFPGDQVLVASYPAELVGGIAAQYSLYAATSVTTIKQLLTFGAGTPDVVSLGGIIEAQSGSSGGAVINQWGRLVALIATTSGGTTTADRDLRGVAMSYISSDLREQTGADLPTTLQGDPMVAVKNFSASTAPTLIQEYIDHLSGN